MFPTKKITHFLFFIVITSSIFGQAPKLIKAETKIYHADEGFWRETELNLYEYSGDLLTKSTRQNWYSLPEKYVNAEIIEYEYNEKNQLILRKESDFTSADAIVQNFYWDEYFYDDKGCLVAQKDSVSSIHGIYDQKYLTFEVDEHCNITEELVQFFKPSGDTTYRKTSKVYDDANLLILDSLFRFYNDAWVLDRNCQYFYDSKDRLVEKKVAIYASFGVTNETEEWIYDEYDQLTYYIRWREKPSPPYQLIKKDSIIIEYDEQNRVHKKQVITTNFSTTSPTDYFTYEYYCQDILKQSSQDDLPRIFRTIYEYDSGFDEECTEELEDISLTIYPNPNNGLMEIKSDLLAAKNAIIRVFDTVGKELFIEETTILKNTHSLNLSFLIPGMYFISVETDAFVASQKVMVL